MVEIVQNKGNTNDPTVKPVHIAYLYPGDTFGERALLYKMDKRQATVMIASEKAELVLINRTIFNELLNNEASTDVDTKRFRSNKDIIRNIFLRNSEQRSEKDLKFVVEYLKGVKFFSRFSFEVRKKLCKVMKLITASVNTIIFEEGQIGRHFYIIFTGSVECSVKAKNLVNANEENVVSTFGEGEYFGELALSVEEVKRHGNVVCTEYSEFLVLSREQYEPLIKNYQNEFRQQYVQMLKRNPYFMVEEWNDDTIECICSVMTEKYFSFQSEICRQGSRATEMFIITRGECLMFHEGKHPITNETVRYELGRFGPNSVLGCAE
jgi:CRP-like cAMP-binding protein